MKEIKLKNIVKKSAGKSEPNFEIYDDGTVAIQCGQCGKIELLGKSNQRAVKMCSTDWMPDSHTCNKCWLEGKENIPTAGEVIQDKISFGQSWNLAVALMSPHIDSSKIVANEKMIKAELQDWQEWFYNQLKGRPKNLKQ